MFSQCVRHHLKCQERQSEAEDNHSKLPQLSAACSREARPHWASLNRYGLLSPSPFISPASSVEATSLCDSLAEKGTTDWV